MVQFESRKGALEITAPEDEPSAPRRNSLQAAIEDDDIDNPDHEKRHPLKSFTTEQAKKYFIDNLPIPILEELPPVYRYPFGILAYMTLLLVFSFFMYSSYNEAINKAFISLSKSDGDCSDIPISVSGTFLADIKGNWIDTPSFLYYDAAYSFTFAGLEVQSLAQYTSMMNNFRDALKSLGERGPQSNLAVNLIMWMSSILYYSIDNPTKTNFADVGYGQLQYVQLTGDPAVVFNGRFFRGGLSDQDGACNATAKVGYDQANALLSLTYDAKEYTANANCVRISPLGNFGQGRLPWTLDEFTYALDVRTFSIAMAVNIGVLRLETLQLASASTIEFNGTVANYSIGLYFDRRYPLMQTIYCLQNTSEIPPGVFGVEQVCALQVSTILAIPVFNHAGASDTIPQPCNCNEPVGKSVQCNKARLIAGLLVYNVPAGNLTPTALILYQTANMIALLSKFGGEYSRLNAAAFNATASSVLIGANAGSQIPAGFSKTAFQFCKLGNGNKCSLISWFIFSTLNPVVSVNKFTLINGSCTDTIGVTDEIWENIAINPPVALTQNYYECYSSKQQALLNAAGVATGNASLFMLLLFFALLPFIYGFLACLHEVPDSEYSGKKKEIVLDTLATALLRAQQGVFLQPHDTMQRLFEELVEIMDEGDGDAEEVIEVLFPKDGDLPPEHRIERLKSSSSMLSSPTPQQAALEIPRGSTLGEKRIRPMKGSYEDKDMNLSRMVSRSSEISMYSAVGSKKYSSRAKSYRPFASMEDMQAQMVRVRGKEEKEMRVLNLSMGEEPGGDRQRRPKMSIDDLVDRLTTLLAHALVPAPVNSNTSMGQSTKAVALLSAPSSIDLDEEQKSMENGEKEGMRSYSQDYLDAFKLSVDLTKYNFEDLNQREDRIIFVRLANALCLHASLELDIEVKAVVQSAKLVHSIAYQIGQRTLSYMQLIAYSQSPISSPSKGK